MSGCSFDRIAALLERATAEGVFPGAALLCTAGDEIRYLRYCGRAALVPGRRLVTPDTRFDVASLTKAVVTSVLAMRAVDEGRLSLDERLAQCLPLPPRGIGEARVEHLLSHRSGLPAWAPLYQAQPRSVADGLPEEERRRVRREIRQAAAAQPLLAPPGTLERYSDLGFLLLEWILEERLGERIDRAFDRLLARPLGRLAAGFVDRDAGPPPAFAAAATARCPWRGRVVEGEVHDPNAAAMGGVAGHAGLFATVTALHALLQELRRCHRGGRGVVRPETIRRFWAPPEPDRGTFRLGWDGPSPSGYSSAGRLLSRRAVGHLGFTGCSVWLDPEADHGIVLLTNRVHPDADNRKIVAFRPVLHDTVVRELGL